MESLEVKRSSGIMNIINREPERIHPERSYSSATTMSVSTTTGVPSYPPPPYSSGWTGPPNSISALISPPESRRTSDNDKSIPPPIQTSQPHRPSLPSISDALANVVPSPNPYVSPVSASLPPPHQQLYNQPSQPPPPRTYSQSEHPSYLPQFSPRQRHASPPPPHQQWNHYPRSDERSTQYAGEQRPPPATQQQQQSHSDPNSFSVPQYQLPKYDCGPRSREAGPNEYHNQAAPPQNPSYYGSAPPHVSGAPQQPAYPQSRYVSRDDREPSEQWKVTRDGQKQDHGSVTRTGVKHHLDVWDLENNLAEIHVASKTLMEWTAHYTEIAQEQHQHTTPIPARMPTLEQVNDMTRHQEKVAAALERMREIIHEHANNEQRAREQGRRQGEYEDDMSMYGEDKQGHGYGSDAKKRRGRAAPPGRCHSCNRAETPEWRRGPDGARTLCNACGLHYAKLTRKNTLKQSQGPSGSSLRPKSRRSSPRPQ